MIYLDNAATSLVKPHNVAKNTAWAVNNLCSPGRGGHAPAMSAAKVAFECREKVSRLFGVGDPENVIFGKNNNLLHVLGGTASYVNPFDANGLFYSLDITNPATPVEVFRDTIPGIIGLAISQPMNADNVNDTIFVSTQAALDTNYNIFQDTAAGMIYVYDCTVPSNIQFLTTLNGGLWNFDCDVVGNIVYVASEWYGIKTLDITNIHNDISLGYKVTGGWNLGSDKFGNTLMVGNEGYGFKKYDITNLQNPIYQSSNRDPGFCMNVKYSANGNLLYGFYLTYDRFRVMDPANNYNVIGSIPTVVGSNDPWVYGTKIASLDLPSIGNKSLFITDVSNPAVPFVDSIIVMNDVKDILVNSTGKLFVARQDTLSVYDLNNNLTKLLSIEVPSNFWNDFIAIAEYKDTIYAYISGLINSGIYKYHYNGSNQLTQIGYFNSINVAYTGNLMLAADSFNLYLSDINKGLFAYNKNTLTQTGYYRDGMEFTVNFLWGPQELFCKDNLIFLVEYFGQTTILSGNPDLMLNTTSFENEYPNQLNIFPIPTDNEITISLSDNNSMSTIEILDFEGRVIFHKKCNSAMEKINTQFYSEGIYFVRVMDGEKSKTGKFLVQH